MAAPSRPLFRSQAPTPYEAAELLQAYVDSADNIKDLVLGHNCISASVEATRPA